jgi:hypothetical protein
MSARDNEIIFFREIIKLAAALSSHKNRSDQKYIFEQRRLQCQGCQIFLCDIYQNGGKSTKIPTNIPYGLKLYQLPAK